MIGIKHRVNQATLRESIRYIGIGLHTGRSVAMRVRPGEADTGIRFLRKDVPQGQGIVSAVWQNVIDTELCTVIGNEHGVSVRSIEHLMAALRGCGVDNALVELDGPELPVMDGSAKPFVAMIERAGIARQSAARRAIQIHKPITVCDADKFALLIPDSTSRFTVEIDFDSAAVGFQRLSVELVDGVFKDDVAGARTFGFMAEVDRLRTKGLARGGSLRNAVVLDGDRVVNEEGLRFADEFVRHKVLDCAGDLYLAGAPILGHFFAHKPGHQLNNALMSELFAQEQAWSYVDLAEVATAPAWKRIAEATRIREARRIAEAKLNDAFELAKQWVRAVA